MSANALEISYPALKKLVLKAYQICNGIPKNYPTVELIDAILDNKLFDSSVQYKEDVFKYCVRFLCYSFNTDDKWHSVYSGYKEPTADNLLKYLYTPLGKSHGFEPHIGIWDTHSSDEEKEDRQAAFEYMQSIVMDQTLYLVTKKSCVYIPA